MTLRQDCKNGYEDPIGVMYGYTKVIDGNALLYTGAKLVLLKDQDGGSTDDTITYLKMLLSAENPQGILNRYGKPGDNESFDDYIGVVAASAFIDNGMFARRVLTHGRSSWFAFNNVNNKWDLTHFFAGRPGWWATIKAAAGEWLNPIDQLASFIDLVTIVVYEDGASGTLMDYLQFKTYIRKCSWWTHPITRLGCVIFEAAYMRRHPKGIKESYIVYYGVDYPFSNLPDGTF